MFDDVNDAVAVLDPVAATPRASLSASVDVHDTALPHHVIIPDSEIL